MAEIGIRHAGISTAFAYSVGSYRKRGPGCACMRMSGAPIVATRRVAVAEMVGCRRTKKGRNGTPNAPAENGGSGFGDDPDIEILGAGIVKVRKGRQRLL